jgi:hypothetical protein
MDGVEQGRDRYLALHPELFSRPSPKVLQIEYGTVATLDWRGSEKFSELELQMQNCRVEDHVGASESADILIPRVPRAFRSLTGPHEKY